MDQSAGMQEYAQTARAWPFEQARALRKRLKQLGKTGPVVFETGYGPSGPPHIGTFGEVVRTCMVRQAFEVLTGGEVQTRLICVSDDMDGLRSVPETLPQRQQLQAHLQKPLCRIPDPFGEHESYGGHMNARLRSFLDRFGFAYEFLSSAELYASGAYDEYLLRALERYEEIMELMLPTLGPQRRRTYSPFLPVSPKTGRILYVPLTGRDVQAGTIGFLDEDGQETELPVTGGAVKLQWKPDFGMRWVALGVDFEMFGKDHQANAPLYSKICKLLGGQPPLQFIYELFLDEQGEKISKSKGNGLSMEEWLSYAPPESLSYFQYGKPRTAKRMHFDVIPRAADEYLSHLQSFPGQTPQQRLENPVWHVHAGEPPEVKLPVSYSVLLNMCVAAKARDADQLAGYLSRYAPKAACESSPLLSAMIDGAMRYYRDRVEPGLNPRVPEGKERVAMLDLLSKLEVFAAGETADAEGLQSLVYETGKVHGFEPLRDWFRSLYEVLFGTESGPRMGSFIAIYGIDNTVKLIGERLKAGVRRGVGQGKKKLSSQRPQ